MCLERGGWGGHGAFVSVGRGVCVSWAGRLSVGRSGLRHPGVERRPGPRGSSAQLTRAPLPASALPARVCEQAGGGPGEHHRPGAPTHPGPGQVN
eukprot:COSAG01_NODE_3140_length_6531_cov_64.348739_2_plen_95_part_00